MFVPTEKNLFNLEIMLLLEEPHGKEILLLFSALGNKHANTLNRGHKGGLRYGKWYVPCT